MLSAYLFENLDQVREITWSWMRVYNDTRPPDGLGKVSRMGYREGLELENSTLKRSA